MKKRSSRPPIALFFLLFFKPVPLLAADLFLLQTGCPLPKESRGLYLFLESGYEGGGLPDAFASCGIGLSLTKRLGLRADFTGLIFPEEEPRPGAVESALSFNLRAGERMRLLLYASALAFLGEPAFAPYEGALPDVAYELSPRAEGGYDACLGLSLDAIVPAKGPFFSASLEGAATLGRKAFDELADPAACMRLRALLCPSLRAGPLILSAQGRGIYWFGRGYALEILPQLQWEALPGLSLAAGLGIPAVGGSSWRLLAGARWTPRESAPPPLPQSGALQLIRERRGARVRLYINFQGDRAELFEPANARYGPENRRLIAELVALLQRYPEYDILVEGHTNRSRFDLSFREEQKSEMLPLAERRAEAVRSALVAAGIPESRLSIKAVGGLKPLVDFEDEANAWRNRRVEIVLRKSDEASP